ncbi:MAG: hypothetical protein IH906_07345 [Proteobacteria bacterium]|nr:hypothetical protein [Pseudomonadota bacterium]
MTTTTFSPGGEFGVRSVLWLEETRFAGLTADCYCCVIEGTCLEPEICDGDMVFADPNRTPEVGEFAMFWPRDGGRPKTKRLVTAVPSTFGPESELVPLVVMEQINPPKQYFAPADMFKTIDAVVGWIKPEEYEALRRPAPGVHSPAPCASHGD